MLKQQSQPQTMTPAQFAQELRDVRSEYEGLRRQIKTIGGRTSALYLALETLKKQSITRENRR